MTTELVFLSWIYVLDKLICGQCVAFVGTEKVVKKGFVHSLKETPPHLLKRRAPAISASLSVPQQLYFDRLQPFFHQQAALRLQQ